MTFFIVQNKVIHYAYIKHLNKIGLKFIKRGAINTEIKHENFYAMINQIRKDTLHVALESPRGIVQTKMHHSIGKCSKGAGAGSLVLIFWYNTNLEINSKTLREIVMCVTL